MNSAFVDDTDETVPTVPNSIVTRHRDKSRELADVLKQDDDPNKVSERIRGVQDRVRDKLRPLLQQQPSPGTGTSADLKLDLTTTSNVNDLNASQLMSQRLNASDKAREAAEQRMRKIKESTYRTAVASGPIKRDETRFDDV